MTKAENQARGGRSGGFGLNTQIFRKYENLDACEFMLPDSIEDGARILEEPHCETRGEIPLALHELRDWDALRNDFNKFSGDCLVELQISSGKDRLILGGPQSAVGTARIGAYRTA